MTKKTGKMALYEAIGASKGSITNNKAPNRGGNNKSSDNPKKDKTISMLEKKFHLELNISRASIAILVLLVLLLGAFKTGQISNRGIENATKVADNTNDKKITHVATISPEPKIKTLRKPVYIPPKPADKLKKDVIEPQKIVKPVVAKEANNVICVTRYMVKRDLIPVKDYFAKNGIELEIIKKSNNYLLITKNRYTGGFTRIGTQAYNDLRKIKRIGAYYKAPEEFEPFGSKPFQDAYGMKLKK